MCKLDIAPLRAAIVTAFPGLDGTMVRPLAEGYHSLALEAEGRLVFKFPKNEAAERALLREARLLAVVRPAISLPVPAMHIHEGPPVFSSHQKLEGGHLLTDDYGRLPEKARERLAQDLARFYAELHRLDRRDMAAAGALPVEAWQPPELTRTRAISALPPRLRDWAEKTVLDYERLPPDPHGVTYGFFDGHGWNMAFDHGRGRLNGIYDFADFGFGALHREFIYSNFISPDLTERIVSAYERLTGLALDRRRIMVLTGYHRLSELAELADDPQERDEMVGFVERWVAARGLAE